MNVLSIFKKINMKYIGHITMLLLHIKITLSTHLFVVEMKKENFKI